MKYITSNAAVSLGPVLHLLKNQMDRDETGNDAHKLLINLRDLRREIMKAIIRINMDNAAFEDPGELSRILMYLAEDIEECGTDEAEYNLQDINGNLVGTCKIK
jgi:hypothetical protein